MRLDNRGIPIAVETSGHDYLKAPVAETFALSGGVARWKNNSETGETKLSGPAFYVSLHAVPEELALLANALLTAPEKRVDLLPAGEATIKRTGELTLGSSDASRHVTSYEIGGLGFTPETIWLDDDRRFFALASSWGSFIREGWEAGVPQLVSQIIDLAHQKGLRVSGHVPAFMTAQQFVEAGADELQHINFVFLNFFADVQDTRTPQRFIAVAERAATLDLDSQTVQSFVKLLKVRGTVVDPTVSIFQGQFTDRAGAMPIGYAPVAERLPVQIRRGLLAGGLPVPEGKDQRYRDSAAALLRMVKLLYDCGVTLVAGTDSTPGFTLHRELELYVQAGIPTSEVLRLATIGAARVMKQDGELGSIARIRSIDFTSRVLTTASSVG